MIHALDLEKSININILKNIKFLVISYGVEYNNDDYATCDIAAKIDELPKYIFNYIRGEKYNDEHIEFEGLNVMEITDIFENNKPFYYLNLYYNVETPAKSFINENDIKMFTENCKKHFLKHFNKDNKITDYRLLNVKSSLNDN